MNFFQFINHKKTTSRILDSIKGNYNTLFESFGLLTVSTKSAKSKKGTFGGNSIKMKVSSRGGDIRRNIAINFPNLLGGGEFFRLNFQDTKNASAEIGRPIFIKEKAVQTRLEASRKTREINEKKIQIQRFEAGLSNFFSGLCLRAGIEKLPKLDIFYGQAILKLFGLRMDVKAGTSRIEGLIPFLKIVGGRKFGISNSRFFLETAVKIGKIFGQTSIVEKFFIGESLRGYKKESIGPVNQNKKIGGNGFIELRNRAGFNAGQFEFFIFGDVGTNSVKGLGDSGRILMGLGDNNCIGKSVGVGMAMKGKRGPSFIFAVPMTTTADSEKYVIGVDFEF